MTDDEKKAAEDNFNHRLADVNRCWVKYALNLMTDSRDRLLDELGMRQNTAFFRLQNMIPSIFSKQIQFFLQNVILWLLNANDNY